VLSWISPGCVWVLAHSRFGCPRWSRCILDKTHRMESSRAGGSFWPCSFLPGIGARYGQFLDQGAVSHAHYRPASGSSLRSFLPRHRRCCTVGWAGYPMMPEFEHDGFLWVATKWPFPSGFSSRLSGFLLRTFPHYHLPLSTLCTFPGNQYFYAGDDATTLGRDNICTRCGHNRGRSDAPKSSSRAGSGSNTSRSSRPRRRKAANTTPSTATEISRERFFIDRLPSEIILQIAEGLEFEDLTIQ